MVDEADNISAEAPDVITSSSSMMSGLRFCPKVPDAGSVMLPPSRRYCRPVSLEPCTFGLPSPSVSVTPGASVRMSW